MPEHDPRELLHAWALDAVDPAEHDAVEHAIRNDPALAEEARALREVGAQLSQNAAVEPPASLREEVLDLVTRTEQEPPVPRISAVPEQTELDDSPSAEEAQGPDWRRRADVVSLDRRRARRRDRWVAAAAVLVAAAVPSVLAIQQGQRADQAEEQLTVVAEALARPGASLVGEDVAGGGRAVAVLGDGSAVFAAQGLAALPAEEDYQLWVVADGAASSAGVLTAADGQLSTEVDQLPAGAVLAMTVEPAGGSSQPTSDPIVALPVAG